VLVTWKYQDISDRDKKKKKTNSNQLSWPEECTVMDKKH